MAFRSCRYCKNSINCLLSEKNSSKCIGESKWLAAAEKMQIWFYFAIVNLLYRRKTHIVGKFCGEVLSLRHNNGLALHLCHLLNLVVHIVLIYLSLNLFKSSIVTTSFPFYQTTINLIPQKIDQQIITDKFCLMKATIKTESTNTFKNQKAGGYTKFFCITFMKACMTTNH